MGKGGGFRCRPLKQQCSDGWSIGGFAFLRAFWMASWESRRSPETGRCQAPSPKAFDFSGLSSETAIRFNSQVLFKRVISCLGLPWGGFIASVAVSREVLWIWMQRGALHSIDMCSKEAKWKAGICVPSSYSKHRRNSIARRVPVHKSEWQNRQTSLQSFEPNPL